MVNMECPQCGKELHIDEQYAGQMGRCQHCQEQITVPITGGWEPTPQPPPVPPIEVTVESPLSSQVVAAQAQGIKIRNPVTHGFGFGCGVILLLLFVFVVVPVGLFIVSAIGLFSVIDQELESNKTRPIVAPTLEPEKPERTETPASPLEDILRRLNGGGAPPETPSEQ